MANNLSRRALILVHRGIERFWIHPLESKLIPRLESGNLSRFRSIALRWLSWLANIGRIAVLDLRLEVRRWVGPDGSVTYIGEGESMEVIRTIFFPEDPEFEEIPNIFLWQVPSLVKRYADQGDLVVCEINELIHWSPGNWKVFFIVPQWIKQVIEEIDKPVEKILASMNQSMRRKIRKLDDQNFSYSVSQEDEDFDLFYYRMYLPYISLRHSGRGMVLHDYASLLNDFRKGKLLLIKDGSKPVGGMLCLMVGDTCYAQQMGVLDGDFRLVKRGVNVAIWWFMLLWSREQGAKRFDVGGSRAQLSNGVFNFKRQWGTRVEFLNTQMHSEWSFYAQSLPENTIRHINALDIITIVNGQCYLLRICNSSSELDTIDFTKDLKHNISCGLSGILLISPNGEQRIITQ